MPVAEQASLEWKKLFFLRSSEEDYKSSADFIKQLTFIVISTIMYSKNAVPRHNYETKTCGEIKLRILKEKCRSDLAQFLSSSLIDAFDALDKQYLHQLSLCFYEDECNLDTLIECHTFEYEYKNNRVSMNVQTSEEGNCQLPAKYTFVNIQEQTLHLLKSYVELMESTNTLPSSFGVSLRLYYHEAAPPEYHAPGYARAPAAPLVLAPRALLALHTRHHGVRVALYTRDRLDVSSDLAEQCDKSNQLEPAGAECQIVCPCKNYGDNDTYESNELLTCVYCRTQQHAVCFGVLREDAPLVQQHCCDRCYDEDPSRRPTDHGLVDVDPGKRPALCAFRRALEYCSRRSEVRVRALVDRFSSSSAARALLRALAELGVLQRDADPDSNSPQPVLVDQLKAAMGKYFNARQASVVDRLVADIELHASQRALVESEAACSQPRGAPADDGLLDQYRHALVPDDIDPTLPAKPFSLTLKRKKEENRPVLSTLKSKKTKV